MSEFEFVQKCMIAKCKTSGLSLDQICAHAPYSIRTLRDLVSGREAWSAVDMVIISSVIDHLVKEK